MITRPGDKFKLLKKNCLISGVYDVSELRNTKAVNRDNLLSIDDGNVEILSPIRHNFDHVKSYNVSLDAYVGSDES